MAQTNNIDLHSNLKNQRLFQRCDILSDISYYFDFVIFPIT